MTQNNKVNELIIIGYNVIVSSDATITLSKDIDKNKEEIKAVLLDGTVITFIRTKGNS
ncbi:MAG: hypothetical protein ABIJ17_02400 [Patescibacteria group bacterium]